MKKTKTQKGITLVALIITIIVLLILAVVTINAIQNDGIISYAENAKEDYIKAQGEEQDMLDYYVGVLESGEVVPTVKELQEQHTFSYYSSLSKAIADANNATKENADADADKAVAGIYVEGEETYVVLMKDTESSESIFVTGNMTINLAGNTLKFTTPEAALYLGTARVPESPDKVTAIDNNVIIDGRIGGSSIEKNIADASDYTDPVGIIVAYGKSLTIKSGTYSVTGNNANKVLAMRIYEQNEKFEMTNAKIIASNNAESSTYTRGMLLKSASAIINNCSFNITANIGLVISFFNSSNNLLVSNTNVEAITVSGYVKGIVNKGIATINNINVKADANNGSVGICNEDGGTIRFYSGNVEATTCALTDLPDAKTYIYGGTFSGRGSYGMIINCGENGYTYIENATIKSGEYNGKYTFASFTGDKGIAFAVDNGVNTVDIDNCNIIGNEIAIKGFNTTPDTINISNSRITGKLEIPSNTTLNLGQNMRKADLTIEGTGTIKETEQSFKGRDK